MHASVLIASRLGQRALSTCVHFTPNSLLPRLNSNSLCDSLLRGKSFDHNCPSSKRGLRRLSAGTQHKSARYPPPRRQVPDEAKQAQKEPVFSQASVRFYVTCHPGLEQVTGQELGSKHIGAFDIRPGKSGVHFRGSSIAVGYAANIWLRSAIRVLVHVAEGPLDGRRSGGDEIYRFFRACTDWPSILGRDQAISVEARVRNCSDIPSALLLQARARDAICDAIRDARRPRPAPPEPGWEADLPLYVTAWQDYLTVYRDMSGQSLHRRGYRSVMHSASLNEAAAAGCLLLAGWPDAAMTGATLADPMCGSGTFLIEAALMATNTAPGLFRKQFPFQGWHDYDAQAYSKVCQLAKQAQRPWEGQLLGNEIHPGALSLASMDAEGAGVAHLVHLHEGACGEWAPRQRPDIVIANPPWGNRLMALEYDAPDQVPALEAAWTELGLFLKAHCRESRAFVLSGNRDATQWLRMRADARMPLTIGGADCRFIKYTVLPPKKHTKAAPVAPAASAAVL